MDGYVIDVVRDDLLIEVQTRGFSSMKGKVSSLLELGHRIRVVHPIAIDKWIVKVDDDGTILSRRRSPKHGKLTDVFGELVSFPELVLQPGFEIHLLLTEEEELRRHAPGRAWRRNGWIVSERRLLEVKDSLLLNDVDDIVALVPDGLPETFTTADLADGLGRPKRTAQQMAYCMRKVGVFDIVGKAGNAIQYRLG